MRERPTTCSCSLKGYWPFLATTVLGLSRDSRPPPPRLTIDPRHGAHPIVGDLGRFMDRASSLFPRPPTAARIVARHPALAMVSLVAWLADDVPPGAVRRVGPSLPCGSRPLVLPGLALALLPALPS